MLFTSFVFFLFFLLFYIIYWAVKPHLRLNVTLFASLIFYATWSIPFFFHFLAILILNYLILNQLNNKNKKFWLIVAIFLNFGNLFFFKYFYFFFQVLCDITGYTGLEKSAIDSMFREYFNAPGIILPLAVSFYTFQITAYAVDVFRGEIPEKSALREYLTFILFFPQLIAGPILRQKEFFPQLRKITSIIPEHINMITGLFLILSGLIKKLLIADNLLPFTNVIFKDPGSFSWSSNLGALLGFSAQLYCDFSGYTDLARGLGKMTGFHLPENFYAPYFSSSVSSLWNNWHRTLTLWLRDYIYIPLGGNRVSFFRAEFNIILTMTFIGLWHGASYNFLVLGLYHGILIAIENAWNKVRNYIFEQFSLNKFPNFKIIKIATVYLLLCSGFVLLQTRDWDTAMIMYRQISSFSGGTSTSGWNVILIGLLMTLFFHFIQNKEIKVNLSVLQYYIILIFSYATFFSILQKYTPETQDFFYFQF